MVTLVKLSNIPNVLTLMRIGLVLPIVLLLLDGEYRWAFTLFVIAGVSDGVDGILARRFKWRSRFGAVADPLADKLLMVSCFFTLAYLGEIDLWIFWLVVARDLFIVAAYLAYRYTMGEPEMRPSLLSKFNTFCQILLVSVLVFNLAFAWIPVMFLLALKMLVAVTTVGSWLHYTVLAIKQLNTDLKQRKERGND